MLAICLVIFAALLVDEVYSNLPPIKKHLCLEVNAESFLVVGFYMWFQTGSLWISMFGMIEITISLPTTTMTTATTTHSMTTTTQPKTTVFNDYNDHNALQ